MVEGVSPLDADQLCTYLHQCVSWDTHAVHCPDPAIDLDWQLTSDGVGAGATPRLGAQLLQPLTMKTWHPEIRTTVPEALSTVPFRVGTMCAGCRWGASRPTAFWPGGKSVGAGYRGVGKLMKGSFGMDEATEVEGRDAQEGAVSAGQSIINMRRAVQRGEAVVGALSPTVLVLGRHAG